MTRLHSSLLLLAVVALLTAGAPAGAGNAEPAAAAGPEVGAGLCPETPTTAPAALELVFPPGDDFILCTCKRCEEEPETICQISPMGYSILCADWYRTHC